MASTYKSVLNKPIKWGGLIKELSTISTLPVFILLPFLIFETSLKLIFVFVVAIAWMISSNIYFRHYEKKETYYLYYYFLRIKLGKHINNMSRIKPIPYSCFDGSVVLLRNGALMKIYKIRCLKDNSSEFDIDEHRNYLMQLLKLEAGWSIQYTLIRSKQSASLPIVNKNILSKNISEGRNKLSKNLFGNNIHIALTYYKSPSKLTHKTIKQDFINGCFKFEENMKNHIVFKNYAVCNQDETFSHLYHLINGGEYIERKWNSLPFISDALDFDLEGEDQILKVNDKYVSTIALTTIPDYLPSQYFRFLLDIGCDVTLTSRIEYLDNFSFVKSLKKLAYNHKDAARSRVDVMTNKQTTAENIDNSALKNYDELVTTISDAQINETVYAKLNFIVMVRASTESDLRSILNNIKNAFNYECGTRIETINSVHSFLSCLPGNMEFNKRTLTVSLDNIVDILPLYEINEGSKTTTNTMIDQNEPALALLRTPGYSPYYLNLHKGDVGHTAIFGKTGSGKSTLLTTIASQYLKYNDAQVVVFQKGGGMLPALKSMGGKYLDPTKDGFRFSLIEDASDNELSLRFIIGFILNMLKKSDDSFKLNDSKLHNQISEAVRGCVDIFKEDEGSMRSTSLASLTAQIQNAEAKTALKKYDDSIFSGEADDYLHYSESPILAIELTGIMAHDDDIRDLFLEYVFFKINQSLTGAPVLIIIDEAQIISESETLTLHFKDYLNTIRKQNGTVIFSTLSVNNFQEPLKGTISSACETKIFMHDPTPDIEQLKKFGIMDEVIKAIPNLLSKKDLIIQQNNCSDVVSLDLSKAEMTFGTASLKDIEYSLTLKEKSPEIFYEAYEAHVSNQT